MLRFRRNKCKIVYRNEYLTSIRAQDSHQSFDVMKFKKIRDNLITKRLLGRKDILQAKKLSDEDLLLVHDKGYIESLKNPLMVGEALMLDYVNPWDDYIFEYFRYVSGGTLLAVQHTLAHNDCVFNLGGGYHHAHPDRAEGFCLINDVAIAIKKLRLTEPLQKVLVIDLDYHQGNGTAKIFRDDPDVFTLSIHGQKLTEINSPTNLDMELPSRIEDSAYMKVLQQHLPAILSQFIPELVIYVAGSDPYYEDYIGNFNLSEEGMLERDIFVYRIVREQDIPLAIVAAGGYGPKSWKIYYNFIKWILKDR